MPENAGETQAPEERKLEPPSQRILKIKNEYPNAIYAAIETQMGGKTSVGTTVGLVGEAIGFVQTNTSTHPLKEIQTKIHGNLMHSNWEDDPENPGHKRAFGEPQKEFNIDTTFTLPNHTYLNDEMTQQFIDILQRFGYESQLVAIPNGNRKLVIITADGNFELVIGWRSADEQASWYREMAEKENSSHYKTTEKEILNRTERSSFHLDIANSHPHLAPSGIPLQDPTQVARMLERSKDLTEVVATVISEVFTPGKRYPEMRMDWLPPALVKEMGTRNNSEVVGRVEPTTMVETQIQESFGLERLTGLSTETVTDLKRIVERLKDPRRAEFMKKHGFKQSNGAVFWGRTGTGKTLAAEAVAEEAGCTREVLKLDEYMTAYIHESARRIGEQLREIKSKSTENNQPIVVHIDEADTILMPVFGDSASTRDASEIRAVLLREFQEPSNVFYILTTNLDPRDPRQADPAIVRNQRLGYLIAFDFPDMQGRQALFEKELSKRTADDLKWEDIDTAVISSLTEGFSPADIQEILSVAAGEAYDPDTNAAFINMGHLEMAITLIKQRKTTAEKIREPIGFVARTSQSKT